MKLRLVMILTILPLLALAGYFAALLMAAEQDRLGQAQHMSLRVEQEAFAGNLLHELQKERGFSAGHIGSSGANFATELTEQRLATDGKIATFVADSDILHADAGETYARLERELQKITQMRQDVSAGATTVPEMAGYYTGMINDIATLTRPIMADGKGASLDVLQRSRASLGAAKEQAGLERAMGSNGLGSTFAPTIYRNFLGHGGAQAALLAEIAREPEMSEVVAELFATPEFRAIQDARDQIVAAFGDSSQVAISAPEWFAISTGWIEVLRAAEIEKSRQIAEAAILQRDSSLSRLTSTTLLSVVTLSLVGLFAIANFESMIRRIKKLTGVVSGFAKGDFSVYIPGINRNDEISRMATAIYRFKQETLALRKDAEAMKELDEAELNAKHGKVVELVTVGLAALADADLSCQFDTPLDGDYDSIRTDFNAASERLRSVLRSIAITVHELDDASSQMKSSALDLSARTDEQVKTIRDTAGQVNTLSTEMEAFGREIDAVTTLAGDTGSRAVDSAALMRDAVNAMSRIQSSSEQINAITTMIDDIAFQTNLLALNAGVEAARAGSAGLGFSVVASEVRALAQRAGEATKQIKGLVDESSEHVMEGGALVNETGAALDAISGAIIEVNDVLRRVASGSKTQIASLQGLTSAMDRVNVLADQNTAMALETRTASEEIATRSGSLSGLISDFRLGGDLTTSEASKAA